MKRVVFATVMFFVILLGTFTFIVVGCRAIQQPVASAIMVPCFILGIIGYVVSLLHQDS